MEKGRTLGTFSLAKKKHENLLDLKVRIYANLRRQEALLLKGNVYFSRNNEGLT